MARIDGTYTNFKVTTVEFDVTDTEITIEFPKNSIIIDGGGVLVEEAFTAGSMALKDESGTAIGTAIDLKAKKLNAVTGVTSPTIAGTSVIATITGAGSATTGKGKIAIMYAHLDETTGAFYGVQG